jgi:hypothetical protein
MPPAPTKEPTVADVKAGYRVTPKMPSEEQLEAAHEAVVEAFAWMHACCPIEDVPMCVECSRLFGVVKPLLDIIAVLDPMSVPKSDTPAAATPSAPEAGTCSTCNGFGTARKSSASMCQACTGTGRDPAPPATTKPAPGGLTLEQRARKLAGRVCDDPVEATPLAEAVDELCRDFARDALRSLFEPKRYGTIKGVFMRCPLRDEDGEALIQDERVFDRIASVDKHINTIINAAIEAAAKGVRR